ncbi:MAG: halocyanin domain-containing protein [Halalkalicoccus sp.]
MKRREFMTAAGVAGAATAAGATGAVGTAAAQEEEPDWDEFVTDAGGYDTTEDLRGEEEVTVEVGAGDGLQFGPAAIWVDPGTTVIWEWTGEGGGHNVASVDGEEYESETTDEAGFTFEHTFEEDGQLNTYQCDPHTAQDMHGGVAVGDDVPTTEVQEGVVTDPTEMGVQIQEHYVGIGAILMISVSLVFTFFVLKYGESPHAKGGN